MRLVRIRVRVTARVRVRVRVGTLVTPCIDNAGGSVYTPGSTPGGSAD